jgi:hypothetical protein
MHVFAKGVWRLAWDGLGMNLRHPPDQATYGSLFGCGMEGGSRVLSVVEPADFKGLDLPVDRAPWYAWADLGGASALSFIVLSFHGGSQKHKVPTNRLYDWSPDLICDIPCTMFRAGARPKAPGARRGPQGAENRPKLWGRMYHRILHKVCPGSANR